MQKKFKRKIIFIGGSTGAGKSSIAHMLGLKMGITRIVSTDMVRQIFRNIVKSDLLDFMNVSSYENFTTNGVKQLAFKIQRETILKIISPIIERFQYEGVDCIIEGVHLHPDLIKTCRIKNYEVFYFLVYIDSDDLHRKYLVDRANEAKNRFSDKYLKHFENIRLIQEIMLSETDNKSINKINNTDFNQSVDKMIDWIKRK